MEPEYRPMSLNLTGTVGAKGKYMSTSVSLQQQVQAKSAASVFVQTLSALVFGAVVLFAVGFMPMSAAHNAAHDTRHALAFPCH